MSVQTIQKSASEQPSLVTRDLCPACRSSDQRTLYEHGFAEPPLRQAIEAHYGRTGGAPEFQYLERATYTLIECLTCGLLFQRHVPNDALMKRIWERWVDPERPFDSFVTHRRLEMSSSIWTTRWRL